MSEEQEKSWATELSLTREQKEHLNKRGPLKAATLECAYKKSVEDQVSVLKQAEAIRSHQRTKK